MWTIAYVDDHWTPLDATLGTAAPADRIAIASSSLADGNESQLLDPLLRFAGQFSVEIAKAKPPVETSASNPSVEPKALEAANQLPTDEPPKSVEAAGEEPNGEEAIAADASNEEVKSEEPDAP